MLKSGGIRSLFMENEFTRTEALIGKAALQKLKESHVAIFGLGGVGGHTAEALVRSGIGAIDIIDSDKISKSNINRQIFALNSTVGRYKTEVAAERLFDINPACKIKPYTIFYDSLTESNFDFSKYDYIIDAIDTVTAKILIIKNAANAGTPVISCMGAGNKMNPEEFEVADIFETSVCPLARVMRRELRRYGIKQLKTVYSKETPLKSDYMQNPCDSVSRSADLIDSNENEASEIKSLHKKMPASIAFVPATVGLLIASEVIKDLTDWRSNANFGSTRI